MRDEEGRDGTSNRGTNRGSENRDPNRDPGDEQIEAHALGAAGFVEITTRDGRMVRYYGNDPRPVTAPMLRVKRLHPDAKLPTRATDGSAGFDLYAATDLRLSLVQVPVSTGLAVEIPKGYVGLVCPRSGMSKRGVVTTIGVIDSDYRGEVMVTLYDRWSDNEPDDPFPEDGYYLEAGDRIAQLVIVPVWTPDVVEVDELSETERGANGFGSTGR